MRRSNVRKSRRVRRISARKSRVRRTRRLIPGRRAARLRTPKRAGHRRRSSGAPQRAYQAGLSEASAVPATQRTNEHLILTFGTWHKQAGLADRPFASVWSYANAFRKGYASISGNPNHVVPLPLRGSASAVVTVCNEEKTVSAVLSELRRLPLNEIIIVLNGCTDGSFAEVRKHPGVTLLHYPERLGHDVGRSLGAAASGGDILLFTDGDLVVPAEELGAFLYAVDGGMDLVLNDITSWLPVFSLQDHVTRSKSFLNMVLGRSDLKSNSLTAVPHALSRRAVQTVGTASLAVPPKAQALAVLQGLHISAPVSVNVIKGNRIRTGNTGEGNAVGRLILGDHIEALGEAMMRGGTRLRLTSKGRAELAKARNTV